MTLILVETPNLPEGDYSSSQPDMAKKKRVARNYTPEFIAKAMSTWDKLRAEGRTVDDIAKTIGVNNSLLYSWKARAEGRGRPAKPIPVLAKKPARTPAVAPSQPERKRAIANGAEIAELKHQIALLKEEREVLKKAVQVFARGG